MGAWEDVLGKWSLQGAHLDHDHIKKTHQLFAPGFGAGISCYAGGGSGDVACVYHQRVANVNAVVVVVVHFVTCVVLSTVSCCCGEDPVVCGISVLRVFV